eukprot:COSAG05_NODE_191_length_14617_cov_90.240736_22_plen_178_part_00
MAPANCYATADERWLQCLGVDLPRHLPRMAHALGIKATLLPALVGTFLCKVPTTTHATSVCFLLLSRYLIFRCLLVSRLGALDVTEVSVLLSTHTSVHVSENVVTARSWKWRSVVFAHRIGATKVRATAPQTATDLCSTERSVLARDCEAELGGDGDALREARCLVGFLVFTPASAA